ncbi:MAG: DUF885 domain-containing protein, partial [Shewanella sp.]
MKLGLLAGSIALIFTLQGCSKPEVTAVQENSSANAVADSGKPQTAEQRYLALVDAYFKDYLKLEPIYATFVGVNEHNADFGGELTEDYLKARHELNTGYLAQVRAIDPKQLPADLQLSYDLFVYDRDMALVDETFPARFIPISQFYSTVITMVQLGSGESAQPFNTVQDYHNWALRVDGFLKWVTLAENRMNQGIESKVVLPRVLVERIIPQLDAMLTTDATQSIFYSPILHFPEGFSEQDKAELISRYQAMISGRIVPALTHLRDYFKQTYLPKARATDGWSGLPNGKAWYQHLANSHTTTTMPVDDIHQMGLSEVARILSEMDKV